MQNTHYWITKFDRLAGNSFENALRLHFDSIHLFRIKSYASALALSILAMEEIAKSHLIEDLVWHARIDGTPLDLSWNSTQKMLHSHRIKQMVFANRRFIPKWDKKKGKFSENEFWKLAESKQLDTLKQNALYVGLIDKDKLRTNNPLSVSIKTPQKYISVVNDYLIDLVVGVLHDTYRIDSESICGAITKPLLRRLIRVWKPGRVGLKAIRFHETDNSG